MPILTYGLEAFPMSENNYVHIDAFISKALNQTQTTSDMGRETQEIQDNSYWIMFENNLTPPSLLVKRNKISIYTKAIRNAQGLNQSLLKSFKTNFLSEEIKQIEQEWWEWEHKKPALIIVTKTKKDEHNIKSIRTTL